MSFGSRPLHVVVQILVLAAMATAVASPDRWRAQPAQPLPFPPNAIGFVRVQSGIWPTRASLPFTPTPTPGGEPSPTLQPLDVSVYPMDHSTERFTVSSPPDGAGMDLLRGRPDQGLRAVSVQSKAPFGLMTGAMWNSRQGQNDWSFAEVGQATPSRDVLLPRGLVKNAAIRLAIQNSSVDRPALVALTWAPMDESGWRPPVLERRIGAGQAIVLDLWREPEARALLGQEGSLRILADVPVAVHDWTSLETGHSTPVYAVEGIPAEFASDHLAIPLLMNGLPGQSSTVAYTNLLDGPVEVTMTYHVIAINGCPDADVVHGGGPVTVPGRATVLLRQFSLGQQEKPSGLPAGCLASADLQAEGGKGVAMILIQGLNNADAYNAVGRTQGSRRVLIPAFQKRYGPHELWSSVVAMNMGTELAVLSCLQLQDDGSVRNARLGSDVFGYLIRPGESNVIDMLPPLAGVAGGSGLDAVIIESTEPLAVLVRSGSTSDGDLASYNGIPLDGAGDTSGGIAPDLERFIPLVYGPAGRVFLPELGR